MDALLELVPGAQRALFRHYHIGGCSSCGFRPDETLEEVCARNENLPVNTVIEFLYASHELDQQLLISPAEVQSAIESPEPKVKLLDIRTREEWDAVHVENSLHFTQELMQEILMHWPREEGLIAVIDHDGKRSMDAVAYFQGHGFANIRAVRGGIDAWSQEVDPALPRYDLE